LACEAGRLVVRIGGTSTATCPAVPIDIQVLFFQSELLTQLLDLFGLLHQGQTQSLDLIVGEGSGIHAPDGLTLQELMQQAYQHQYQLTDPVLDVFTGYIDARGCIPSTGRGSSIQQSRTA